MPYEASFFDAMSGVKKLTNFIHSIMHGSFQPIADWAEFDGRGFAVWRRNWRIFI